MPPTPSVIWQTLLGDHPATRALRDGRVNSSMVSLAFADVAVPNKAFKRVVRDVEFDVAELALMTFLMARSRGVPLRLFPVVLFGRNPLPLLIRHADRPPFGPRDLVGRRVGVRAYTTTTAVWMRAMLADRFGVDADLVEWVTFEEGHVAGMRDPPNVHRDAAHANLVEMLLDGAIDAAIVDPVPTDPRVVPVVTDATAVCRAWEQDTGARPLNHVVVVREALADDDVLMRELFRMFQISHAMADKAGLKTGPASLVVDPPPLPLGLSAHRRSLTAAIAAAESQGLLAKPLAVEDLVTAGLAALR